MPAGAGRHGLGATTDLTARSIEDLINIEVTSVSKKEEKLFQTAARGLRHHTGRYPPLRHGEPARPAAPGAGP